eukprot:GSChrysophyteH1.ASY1.ANO1.876.1 assembled CDS
MALREYVDKVVSVITNDGRQIVGTLKGFDQTINIILEKTHERVFSLDHEMELNELGLYVIRGDNISMVAELDSDADKARDSSKIRAEPLRPVRWE